jgi:MFS family permease
VVADVVPVEQRPKYIGRLQACVGLGFVLGPVVVLLLNKMFEISTKVSKSTHLLTALYALQINAAYCTTSTAVTPYSHPYIYGVSSI